MGAACAPVHETRRTKALSAQGWSQHDRRSQNRHNLSPVQSCGEALKCRFQGLFGSPGQSRASLGPIGRLAGSCLIANGGINVIARHPAREREHCVSQQASHFRLIPHGASASAASLSRLSSVSHPGSWSPYMDYGDLYSCPSHEWRAELSGMHSGYHCQHKVLTPHRHTPLFMRDRLAPTICTNHLFDCPKRCLSATPGHP